MRIFFAAAYALRTIFSIISFFIVIDAFASWIPSLYCNPTIEKILNSIHTIISPLLKLSRWILSKISLFDGLPIDISPIVALFLVRAAQWLCFRLLGLVFFL